jgi:hypothetical protein
VARQDSHPLRDLESAEKELNDYTDRILAAVGVKFGRDSSEYEEAGGTTPQ